MENLINLLERKNLCFRSFHKLCADFIEEIDKGETANLEQFHRRRQGLIKVLEQLEFEVTHWLENMRADQDALENMMTLDEKRKVNRLFSEKDGLVRSILDLDLQILAHVDRIKDETIKKLQALQAGKKTVGAYRSPLDNIEAAEKPKILDQEA